MAQRLETVWKQALPPNNFYPWKIDIQRNLIRQRPNHVSVTKCCFGIFCSFHVWSNIFICQIIFELEKMSYILGCICIRIRVDQNLLCKVGFSLVREQGRLTRAYITKHKFMKRNLSDINRRDSWQSPIYYISFLFHYQFIKFPGTVCFPPPPPAFVNMKSKKRG